MNRLQRRKQQQRLRLIACIGAIAALALVIGLLIWLISGNSAAEQWMEEDPYTFTANKTLTAEKDSFSDDNLIYYIAQPSIKDDATEEAVDAFLEKGKAEVEALAQEETEEDYLYRFIFDYKAVANGKNTNLKVFYKIIRKDAESGEKKVLSEELIRFYLDGEDKELTPDDALGKNTEKKLSLMLKADKKSLDGMNGFSIQGDELILYLTTGEEKFSAKAVEKASLIDPDKPMVAITFDDGPGGYSKEIADLFAEYNGHTTFFVLGSLVPHYEDNLKYVYEMGNEIGSHTYNHKNLNIQSEATIRDELDRTKQVIYDTIGAYPTVVRTPYGNANSKVMEIIDGPVILWSVDSEDWKSRDADTIVREVLNYVDDGDIVLLHEIYGFSFNATKTILKELAEDGYQFVTVSELMKYKGIAPEGKIYSSEYIVK